MLSKNIGMHAFRWLVQNAFRVDPMNGTIFVNASLDYDVIRRVQFMLMVEDENAEEPKKPQMGSGKIAACR